MAVINDPIVAANIARVGNVTYVPQHVTAGPFPIGSGGGYRLGMTSANMAASLAADSEIFQFRYVTAASRVALVHGISISAGIGAVASSAATNLSFRGFVARSWTVAGSGGTRATLTGNNAKLRTSQATTEVNDIGISSTAALTIGTKTLDAQEFCATTFGVLTGAITVALQGSLLPKVNMFGDFSGTMAWPLVLANQEGFVIRNGLAFPAGMVWRFSVEVAWSEVDAF